MPCPDEALRLTHAARAQSCGEIRPLFDCDSRRHVTSLSRAALSLRGRSKDHGREIQGLREAGPGVMGGRAWGHGRKIQGPGGRSRSRDPGRQAWGHG